MRTRRLRRCAVCGLSPALCLCAELPRLAPRTRVTVVAHRVELFKSSNSGRLAVHMLEGARLVSRGSPSDVASRPEPGSYVLYPSPEAQPLEQVCDLRALVVPDGTWTQAKRIARRDPHCRGLSHVRLSEPGESAYGLRRNARAGGLCTLEAIAAALRVLEGPRLADALLAPLADWVARSLRVRAGDHEHL